MDKLNLYCQAGYTTQRLCVQQDSSLKEIIIDLYNIEGISCHVLSFQTGSYVDSPNWPPIHNMADDDLEPPGPLVLTTQLLGS